MSSSPSPPPPHQDQKVPDRRATVVSIGLGLVIAVVFVAWGRVFPPDEPPKAGAESPMFPVPSNPAEPPSQYPPCEELHQVFERARVEHRCTTFNWTLAKGICEMAFQGKGGCTEALGATVACYKAASSTSWSCSEKGEIALDPVCTGAQTALAACLNR